MTAAGEHQPLDPTPLPAAQITDRDVAVHRDHLGALRCRVPTPDYPAAVFEKVHRPHHATCLPAAPATSAGPSADTSGTTSAGADGAGRVVRLDAYRQRHRSNG